MRIDSLRVRDVRNLAAVAIDPDPRFNVIHGANGQGKTNLLEAVGLLSSLKSFRSFRNRDLIRSGADEGVIEARVDRAGQRRDVRITVRPTRKRVELNDSVVRQLSDFFGAVNVVVFSPEDVSVFRGGPGDRRVFLDRMIFAARPAFAAESADYDTVLRQRNAVLKHDQPDRALIAVYDDQLIELGATMIERRIAFLNAIREPFVEAFGEIFDTRLPVDLGYVTRWTNEPLAPDVLHDAAGVREALRSALDGAWHRDRARGFTTVGPHRDDIDAMIEGQPLGTWGSQGQHRAWVLALKITEIRQLRDRLGHDPILLLDDVSSELDPKRNAKLFDFLSDLDGQVFITTTDVAYIRLAHPFARWAVSGGEVTRVDE